MGASQIEITFLFGSIELGQPTGRMIVDRDGWIYPEFSDTIIRDEHGKEIERKPVPTIAGFRFT